MQARCGRAYDHSPFLDSGALHFNAGRLDPGPATIGAFPRLGKAVSAEGEVTPAATGWRDYEPVRLVAKALAQVRDFVRHFPVREPERTGQVFYVTRALQKAIDEIFAIQSGFLDRYHGLAWLPCVRKVHDIKGNISKVTRPEPHGKIFVIFVPLVTGPLGLCIESRCLPAPYPRERLPSRISRFYWRAI